MADRDSFEIRGAQELGWFRFYDEVVDDIKVQALPAETYKFWTNMLCLASRGKGLIGTVTSVTWALRLPISAVELRIKELLDAGLLHRDGDGYRPHNWSKRQFVSDDSKERVRRHREKRKHLHTSDSNGEASHTSEVTCNEYVAPLSSVSVSVSESVLGFEENPDDKSAVAAATPKLFDLQTEWFVELWELAWRKIDKQESLKAFRKQASSERMKDLIIAAVKRDTPAMMARPSDKRPYMSTWLNKGRMLDEGEIFEAAVEHKLSATDRAGLSILQDVRGRL